MGQLTNQIATEAEARAVGGSSAIITNLLCVTKTRAIALGCKVSGTYETNQLVRYSDLSKAWTRPSNVTIYYALGNGTAGWQAQMLKSSQWVNLATTSSTSNMLTFGTNKIYTTSLQSCRYGSSGHFVYPSHITIEYKYKLDSTSSTFGKYKLWREVLSASSTTGAVASVFDDSVKVFGPEGIPEGTENLGTNAIIYAYIYPGNKP